MMIKKQASDCDKFIYKLIPESKAEIDKLVQNQEIEKFTK